jgi:hypothetical protein
MVALGTPSKDTPNGYIHTLCLAVDAPALGSPRCSDFMNAGRTVVPLNHAADGGTPVTLSGCRMLDRAGTTERPCLVLLLTTPAPTRFCKELYSRVFSHCVTHTLLAMREFISTRLTGFPSFGEGIGGIRLAHRAQDGVGPGHKAQSADPLINLPERCTRERRKSRRHSGRRRWGQQGKPTSLHVGDELHGSCNCQGQIQNDTNGRITVAKLCHLMLNNVTGSTRGILPGDGSLTSSLGVAQVSVGPSGCWTHDTGSYRRTHVALVVFGELVDCIRYRPRSSDG